MSKGGFALPCVTTPVPDVHDPSRTAIAWGISRLIMEQQLIWSDEAISAYCEFLQEWAPDLHAQRQDEVRPVMGQPMPTFREACAREDLEEVGDVATEIA